MLDRLSISVSEMRLLSGRYLGEASAYGFKVGEVPAVIHVDFGGYTGEFAYNGAQRKNGDVCSFKYVSMCGAAREMAPDGLLFFT